MTGLPPEIAVDYAPGPMLGRGGMGVVWEATERATGRRVAVKLLAASSVGELARRFRREGRLAAQLDHPRVVKLLAAGMAGDQLYIVMERVPGGSLRARLHTRLLMDVGAATAIALDVLEGLAACHDAGIVHRDVKPENILLDAEGRAKLADLGLACSDETTAITRTGAMLGTPRYMAPEQLLGDGADESSDLYAVALILHEMLAGQLPYPQRALGDLLEARLAGPPPPLRVRAPHVPPALAAVVDECLAAPREQRVRSATLLAAEIRRAVAPAAPRPDPLPARTRRVAWGSVLLIVVVLLGISRAVPRGPEVEPGSTAVVSAALPPPTAAPVSPAARLSPPTAAPVSPAPRFESSPPPRTPPSLQARVPSPQRARGSPHPPPAPPPPAPEVVYSSALAHWSAARRDDAATTYQRSVHGRQGLFGDEPAGLREHTRTHLVRRAAGGDPAARFALAEYLWFCGELEAALAVAERRAGSSAELGALGRRIHQELDLARASASLRPASATAAVTTTTTAESPTGRVDPPPSAAPPDSDDAVAVELAIKECDWMIFELEARGGRWTVEGVRGAGFSNSPTTRVVLGRLVEWRGKLEHWRLYPAGFIGSPDRFDFTLVDGRGNPRRRPSP